MWLIEKGILTIKQICISFHPQSPASVAREIQQCHHLNTHFINSQAPLPSYEAQVTAPEGPVSGSPEDLRPDQK